MAQRRKTGKTPYHSQRVDLNWKESIPWDPVWRIRIYDGKNTSRIHMHYSGAEATLVVQQSTETVPSLHIFTSQQSRPGGAGGMSYTPQRIYNQTNPLPGTSVWLARLHWYRQCVRPWSWWGSLWGTISVHSSRFQMGMDRRHKKLYKNTSKPKWQTH